MGASVRSLAPTAGLLLSLGLACGGDPLQADAVAYEEAMRPNLEENMALAQDFIDLAADIKLEKVDGDQIVSRWEKDVIPKARSLHGQAEAIQPETPQLAEQHAQLVSAWSDRADSYERMKKAYRDNDPDAFGEAFEKNVAAKLVEETYFRETNALLGPYGVHLDQFPPAP